MGLVTVRAKRCIRIAVTHQAGGYAAFVSLGFCGMALAAGFILHRRVVASAADGLLLRVFGLANVPVAAGASDYAVNGFLEIRGHHLERHLFTVFQFLLQLFAMAFQTLGIRVSHHGIISQAGSRSHGPKGRGNQQAGQSCVDLHLILPVNPI
jgi:hypothetical protein